MTKLEPKQLAILLFELTEGKTVQEIHELLPIYVQLLSRKQLISKSGAIIKEYTKLYNTAHHITPVSLQSVEPLQEKEKERLGQILKEKYKGDTIEITEVMNRKLIGGIRVQAGDTVYDISTRRALHQLQTNLEN